MSDKWFANKGQIVQLIVQIIACLFAGIKYLPDFQRNQFFTLGSSIFVLLVVLVISSIGRLISTIRDRDSHAVVYERPIARDPVSPSTANIYHGSVTAGKSSSSTPADPATANRIPAVPAKRFSCTSGLNRIGKKDGIWVLWTTPGHLNAAAVTFKNETDITLRNVIAYGIFYDNQGHQLGLQLQLPWVDETHPNTVFAVGESRTLLVAVLAKQTDTHFSRPDGKPLAAGNCLVSVKVFVDNGQYMDTLKLNLTTTPYFGIVEEHA